MNSYVETDLAQEYQFHTQNCPAGLHFFRNGELDDFTSELSSEKIATWLLQKNGKSAIKITSAQQAKQFALSDEFVVLGLFKDIKSKVAKDFLAAGQQIALAPFGISDEAEVFKKYNVTGDSAILMLRNFDDPVVVYRGEMNLESIVNFVKTESLPLVLEWNNLRHLRKAFFANRKTGILIVLIDKNGISSNLTEAVRKAAKRFQGNVPFLIFHNDNLRKRYSLCNILRADPAHLPAIRYLDDKRARPIFYKPSQDAPEFITAENIKLFVKEVLAGKLQPFNIRPF